MSEWSIEHAWKACVLKGTEGSNPSLSATYKTNDEIVGFFISPSSKKNLTSFEN